jgi:hypothetical protein
MHRFRAASLRENHVGRRRANLRPPGRVSADVMNRTLIAATVLAASVWVPAATADKPPDKPPKKQPGPPVDKPGKQAGALSLTVTPNPVRFGQSVTISGTLTGPNPAGRTITLREDPFPFDDLSNVGTVDADAAGNYSFVRSPTANTRYQTRQGGTESEIVTVTVKPRVSLRVGDRTPAAGTRVRLRGKVCPEHDGGTVQIQRRKAPKQWRTVAQVTLADAGTCSSYTRRLRVRRDGAFRTLFAADSDHAAARSRVRRIDVH